MCRKIFFTSDNHGTCPSLQQPAKKKPGPPPQLVHPIIALQGSAQVLYQSNWCRTNPPPPHTHSGWHQQQNPPPSKKIRSTASKTKQRKKIVQKIGSCLCAALFKKTHYISIIQIKNKRKISSPPLSSFLLSLYLCLLLAPSLSSKHLGKNTRAAYPPLLSWRQCTRADDDAKSEGQPSIPLCHQ